MKEKKVVNGDIKKKEPKLIFKEIQDKCFKMTPEGRCEYSQLRCSKRNCPKIK